MSDDPERPDPSRFPLDDKRVYDAYIAGRRSAAIAAGVRAGLFDRLAAAETPPSFDDVRSAMGWSERGTRSMLAALMAMGLVEARSNGFVPSDDARAYLTRGTPGSLWGLVDMEVDHYLSPRALLDALEKDDATAYGDADPWEAHEEDPAKARAFTAAMHSVSERPAAGFAERVDLGGVERLLDGGGGSAAISIALARENPGLECVVWDIPSVCPLAEEYVADAGLSERISAQPGDMFGQPYPEGFDAVLLSQILHDWGFEKGEALVRKAFEALTSGGRLLVHEKLVEDDGRTPIANVLVHLDLFVWTVGLLYGARELAELLERTGFVDVERTRTAGYWSVVEGRRP